MKNLLLSFVLLFTISFTNAQEQFSEHYNYFIVSSEESEEWTETDVILTFNVDNNNLYYQLYMGLDTYLLRRISDFEEGSTRGGMEFISFKVSNIKSNETFTIQYFKDNQYGIRLLFKDHHIQFISSY